MGIRLDHDARPAPNYGSQLVIKKALIVLALAGGLALAAPMAASADPYAPIPDGGTATIAPGGTVTFQFLGFDPNETVTFTLSGENSAGLTLAGSISLAKPASGSGTVLFSVTSSTSGTFTGQAVGATSGHTVHMTVIAQAALPSTGVADPTPAILVAGTAVVLGAGAIAGAVAIRRRATRTAA